MATAGRRMTLVTVDQILSGASNLLVVIFIAHLLPPVDFGRFTLLFLGYTVASVIGRSLIGLTAMVHPEDADDRPGAILGSSVLYALGCGVVFVAAGAGLQFAAPSLGESLMWLGLFIPLMLIQDVGRFIGIARRQPGRAIWLDGQWMVLEVALFAMLFVRDDATLVLCSIVWGASGAVSGLWVFVQYAVPRLSDLNFSWLRSRWDFSWRSMVTSVTTQASALIGFSAVALVSSGIVVGAVRAANLLTRPAATVINGVARSGVADMARERPDTRALAPHMRRTLLVSMAAAIGNLVVLVSLPDVVGRAILGQTWPVAEPLLLAAGLQVVCIAARNGTRAALMARRDIRVIMIFDIAGSVLLITLSFAGALIAEAQGVMWATVIGQAILTVVWWFVFRSRLRRADGPFVTDQPSTREHIEE